MFFIKFNQGNNGRYHARFFNTYAEARAFLIINDYEPCNSKRFCRSFDRYGEACSILPVHDFKREIGHVNTPLHYNKRTMHWYV